MFNVLVIDDEQMICDLVEQALSMAGFKVETVDDSERGMVKFDSGLYDLVVTDVRMPGVDGRVVLHHIRHSERKSTPVIGLSGTPWLLHNGDFDAVLHKPFAIQNLIDKAKLLTQKELVKESA